VAATAAAAATTGHRCGGRGRRSLRTELDGEVDDDVARVAGDVVDADLVAVALLDLVEQRQRGGGSLTKRMTSPSSSDSSAPKMAAWRKRLATPRASKG